LGRDIEDYLRSAEEGGSDLWHRLRAQSVAGAQEAYQNGREAYAKAIRAGQNVMAQTPSQVARLGRGANAAVRAAGNAISMNQADKLEAATEVLLGAGGTGNMQQRYQKRLALQRRADADAQREFPGLYKWSGRAGDVAGILAMDSPAVASGAARLLPGGGKLVKGLEKFRPEGFIRAGYGRLAAGIGGTVNAAVQAGDDALHGRPVTLGREADAFASGAIGTAAAAHGNPAMGAAVGGGLNTALQEADEGRLSAEDVLNSGLASAYAGRGFATAGQAASNALSRNAKGELGEAMSFAKAWARGEPIPLKKVPSAAMAENIPGSKGVAGPQVPIKLSNDDITRVDFGTLWGRAIEAKNGLSATLRGAQRFAPVDLSPHYLPDHWSPANFGDLSGGAFGTPFGFRYPDDGDAG
jgi:hypothetical protein